MYKTRKDSYHVKLAREMQLSERDVTKGLETTVFSSKPSETDCKLRCRKMFVHMSLEKSFSGRKQIFLQKGVNSNSQ